MRILVTGASGKLGSYLLHELADSRHAVAAWSGTSRGRFFGFPVTPVDLADAAETAAAFQVARPELVIHTAAKSGVADCAIDSAAADRVNVFGTRQLAELAAAAGARLLLVSSDMVFDGRGDLQVDVKQGNYREGDVARPLSVYGRSKLAAEHAALAHETHLVVRVSLMFGPAINGRSSFFDELLRSLRHGSPIRLFRDEWRTALGLRAAARLLLRAAESDARGLLHLGGPERLSRLEMGQRLAAHLGLNPDPLVSTELASAAGAEPRPADLSLDSSRFQSLFHELRLAGYEASLAEMGLTA